MFLSFFEPANRKDTKYFEYEDGDTHFSILMNFELTILSLFLVDSFLEFFHRIYDKIKLSQNGF